MLSSEQPITVKTVLGAIFIYGAVGSTLGVASYSYLEICKKHPLLSVGAGSLVGVKAISFMDIAAIIKRLFNVSNGQK